MTNRIHIKQQMDEQKVKQKLKAEGSDRILFLPTRLRKILARWKEYQAERLINPRFVLQNATTALPVTDKQLRNFIYRSYAKIGLAIIEDDGSHVKLEVVSLKVNHLKLLDTLHLLHYLMLRLLIQCFLITLLKLR